MARPTGIHAVMVVWGEPYTTLFRDVFLPTFLSPGNLPALREAFPGAFRIYSTPEDGRRIMAAPAYRTLRELGPVEWVDLAAVDQDPGHGAWSCPAKFGTLAACHRDALIRAHREDAGLMLLGPDTLISDGAGARVARLARDGRRGLFLNHLSILDEPFLAALDRSVPADSAGVRTLSPGALTRLGMAHLHPWMACLYLDGGPFQISSQMYFKVGEEGHLAHAWHLSPFYLHPQRLPGKPFLSVDNDFTCQVIDDPDSLVVPRDSDDVSFVELLPRRADRTTRPQPYPFSPLRFALGAEGLFPSPHNAHWARQGIRWHGGPASAAWAPVEARATRTVADTIRWLELLDPTPDRALEPDQRREASAMVETLRADLRGLEAVLAAGGREHHPGQLGYLWANLGKLLAVTGHIPEAGAAFERQLDLAPGNPHGALRVSRRAQALGLEELAGRALKRVAELDPRLLDLEASLG